MPTAKTKHSFSLRTTLRASPEVVWAAVTTAKGVNDELFPLVRMTIPRGLAGLDVARAPLGRTLGRSWILLFGVLPVDYDDLLLERRESGVGFRERSTMWTQSEWIHERTLTPLAGGGCVLVDRLEMEPRIAWLGALQAVLFRFVFAHRHRRLMKRFGRAA